MYTQKDASYYLETLGRTGGGASPLGVYRWWVEFDVTGAGGCNKGARWYERDGTPFKRRVRGERGAVLSNKNKSRGGVEREMGEGFWREIWCSGINLKEGRYIH